MNRFLGVTLIVLALGMAILPQYTDCQSQGKSIALPNGTSIPMKCHWTAQAEIATAVPLMAVGAVLTATRRKENLRILAGMGSILGIFGILLPNTLIGVCSTSMLCNTLMKPALTVFSSLAIVTSLGSLALTRKPGE